MGPRGGGGGNRIGTRGHTFPRVVSLAVLSCVLRACIASSLSRLVGIMPVSSLVQSSLGTESNSTQTTQRALPTTMIATARLGPSDDARPSRLRSDPVVNTQRDSCSFPHQRKDGLPMGYGTVISG